MAFSDETFGAAIAYTNKKIDSTLTEGISEAVEQQAPAMVNDYCEEHFSEWEGALDDTFTQSNMAAPAKATGDAITNLNSALNERTSIVNPVNLADHATLVVGKFVTGTTGNAVSQSTNAKFAFFKVPIKKDTYYTVTGTSYAIQIVDENDIKLGESGSNSSDVPEYTFRATYNATAYAYVNFKFKKFPAQTYMVNEGEELADYTHYFPSYIKIGGVDHYEAKKDVYVVTENDNLMDLFKYLTNDESEKYIYVTGNHDVFSELGGSTYAQSITSGTNWKDCNVFVPKNTHLIGYGNATLTFKPTESQIGSVAMALLSPINAPASDFWMENIRIDAENCRYCIHDDTSSVSDFGSDQKHTHSYKNVHCVKGRGGNPQCYGGGNTGNTNYVFEECYFESYSLPWSTHNNDNSDSGEYHCANFLLSSCAFNNTGTSDYALRFGNVTWRQENIGVMMVNCAANKKLYLYKESGGSTIKNAYNLTIIKSSYTDIYSDEMTNVYTPIIMN